MLNVASCSRREETRDKPIDFNHRHHPREGVRDCIVDNNFHNYDRNAVNDNNGSIQELTSLLSKVVQN